MNNMNLKFYIVSYDECRDMVFDKLSPEEKNKICCYAVNQSHSKRISPNVNVINEWDLNNYDSIYQDYQYYEYSFIAHSFLNQSLTNNLSHIGLLHYDVAFDPGSVNRIIKEFESNPNQIQYMFYIRDPKSLYMSRTALDNICQFMSSKLKLFINSNHIWNEGFIGYSMAIAPVHIFQNFGKFMAENHEEIEDIIRTDKWSINEYGQHRPCGLVERMWGFYLLSTGLPLKKISGIIHDSSPYTQKAWGEDLKTFKI